MEYSTLWLMCSNISQKNSVCWQHEEQLVFQFVVFHPPFEQLLAKCIATSKHNHLVCHL